MLFSNSNKALKPEELVVLFTFKPVEATYTYNLHIVPYFYWWVILKCTTLISYNSLFRKNVYFSYHKFIKCIHLKENIPLKILSLQSYDLFSHLPFQKINE